MRELRREIDAQEGGDDVEADDGTRNMVDDEAETETTRAKETTEETTEVEKITPAEDDPADGA
jgi:hypothetical protein